MIKSAVSNSLNILQRTVASGYSKDGHKICKRVGVCMDKATRLSSAQVMTYHSLIAATNSIALRRSNNKSNTNPRILEDVVSLVCVIIAVMGIIIKTKLVKAICTVVHTYMYSMINVSKLNRQKT
jgi:hypothetical protein